MRQTRILEPLVPELPGPWAELQLVEPPKELGPRQAFHAHPAFPYAIGGIAFVIAGALTALDGSKGIIPGLVIGGLFFGLQMIARAWVLKTVRPAKKPKVKVEVSESGFRLTRRGKVQEHSWASIISLSQAPMQNLLSVRMMEEQQETLSVRLPEFGLERFRQAITFFGPPDAAEVSDRSNEEPLSTCRKTLGMALPLQGAMNNEREFVYDPRPHHADDQDAAYAARRIRSLTLNRDGLLINHAPAQPHAVPSEDGTLWFKTAEDDHWCLHPDAWVEREWYESYAPDAKPGVQ